MQRHRPYPISARHGDSRMGTRCLPPDETRVQSKAAERKGSFRKTRWQEDLNDRIVLIIWDKVASTVISGRTIPNSSGTWEEGSRTRMHCQRRIIRQGATQSSRGSTREIPETRPRHRNRSDDDNDGNVIDRREIQAFRSPRFPSPPPAPAGKRCVCLVRRREYVIRARISPLGLSEWLLPTSGK